MAIITPNLQLTIWNSLTDPYDSSQLAQNFFNIDAHDHTENRGVKIPNGGLISTQDLPGVEAVNTNVIRDLAITTVKVNDLAITTAKINDLAVTNDKLASLSVSESKIQSNAVTTDKINNDAVTSAKILDGAVGSAEIATDAVTSDELSKSTSNDSLRAVTTDHIKDSAITSAKIANDTIVDADVNANAAIADTKLATISTPGKVANAATTATNANNPSTIVARNGSGDFAAGTITASLSGNATTATNLISTTTVLSSNVVESSIQKLGVQAQNLNMGTNFKVINLKDPDLAQDGATKKYVDSAVANLSANQKTSCKVATPGTTETYLVDATTKSVTHIKNLSGGTSPALDGHTLAVNDRVLIKDAPGSSSGTGSAASPNSSEIPNGIYTVKSPLGNGQVEVQRATDMDADAEVLGARTFVETGTINAGTTWNVSTYTAGSNPPAISGVVYWVKVGSITAYTGSNGITVSGQDISLSSSTAGTGLTYTTGVLSVNATQSGITSAANLATVGTITSGTWQGNVINATYLPIASTTNRGTASFSTNNFEVNSGVVTIKSAGVANAQLANSSITIGSSAAVSLGGSITTIAGLTLTAPTISTITNGAATLTLPTTTSTIATTTGTSINGQSITLGTTNTGITASNPNALTIGTGLSGTSYNGSAAVTIAIDNTVATLTGNQALTNKNVTLKVGTTSAAPLVFTKTSAALLTTPVAGAMEVDANGDLYFTPSTTQKKIAFTDTAINNSQLAGNGIIQIGSDNIALGTSAGTNANPLDSVYLNNTVLQGTTATPLTASSFVKTNSFQQLTTVANISASDFAVQSPNTVLAGPASGASTATPTFRTLTSADLPASPTLSGTVTLSSLNSSGVVKTNGSGVLSTSAVTTNDIANGTITKSDLNSTTAGSYVLPKYVGSLSGTWQPGDEVYYSTGFESEGANVTTSPPFINFIDAYWHLRYNEYSTVILGTTYTWKWWQFLGGPPYLATIANTAITNNTDEAITAVGSAITIPGGSYSVSYGGNLDFSYQYNNLAYMSVLLYQDNSVILDTCTYAPPYTGATNTQLPVAGRAGLNNNSTNPQTLQIKVKTNKKQSGVNSNFNNGYISVTPNYLWAATP